MSAARTWLRRAWPDHERRPLGGTQPRTHRIRFVDDILRDRPIRLMPGRNPFRRATAEIVPVRAWGARLSR